MKSSPMIDIFRTSAAIGHHDFYDRFGRLADNRRPKLPAIQCAQRMRFGGREAYLRPARNRQTLRPGVALKLVEVHALAAEALAKRKWV
jgi:hypothetical protein